MQLPGLSILTLSSLEDVEELLVKRANVYSGRPPHTLVNDLYVKFICLWPVCVCSCDDPSYSDN